jgi:predicted DNA-binding transcriptional regulator YafY
MFLDLPNDRFAVHLNVDEGEGFYQWVAKYGSNTKIESPHDMIDEYKTCIKNIMAQYE